jgi:hypothetical protein
MSIFQPSGDPAYLAWLDANPNDHVINTERDARVKDLAGHRTLARAGTA